MNQHDSERLAGLLEHEGYEPAVSEADAELIVLNTCSVRERAEEKLYSRLGEIRLATAARSGDVAIAVTGCVAQQEGERLLRRAPYLDTIVGTQALKHLPDRLREAREHRSPRVDVHPYDDVSFPLGVVRASDPVRAWVTIIEGCNEFCAFCVVPYTRGKERMRPAADILAEVRQAVRSGRVEVQLLGQIVNHYQAPDDPSCDFAALLARVSAVPGLLRVRFASPHPRHVTPQLVAAIRDVPKVCKHLHLPVQSGSTRILTAMRRRYTRESYLAGVRALREAIPAIEISTDVIVGFPGETAEDFEATMSLVRALEFQSIYSFKYSVRPNTLAMKRMADDVPEREKTSRIMALQALQRDIQLERHGRMIGSVHDVLVDARSGRRSWELAGRTTGNTIVNFPGEADLVGQVVPVRITGAAPNSVRGEVVAATGLCEPAEGGAHAR
jgi:tRNA-2-methylthio-N6-dimethylallyladenosine synthase